MQEKIISRKSVVVGVLAVIVLCLSILFYLSKNGINENIQTAHFEIDDTAIDLMYEESSLKNNPKPLQDLFLSKIKNSENDKDTKMAAYWIVHRFFDNGGDAKEIYDYVQSNPALSFLNEAENVYPESFKDLKDGKIPVGTYAALYIALSYMEILDKYDYSDIAMLSTLSCKYAELAYFYKEMAKSATSTTVVDNHNNQRELALEKSQKYFHKTTDYINEIMESQGNLSKKIDKRDILVGVNQYFLAIAYYQNLKAPYASKYTKEELFTFASTYSEKEVPILYKFTSYLYAVALAKSGEIENRDSDYMDRLLSPFLRSNKETHVTKSILESKYKFHLYGRENLSQIGSHTSIFKKWLIENSNGNWVEGDFR
ncbi:hypothetical protein K9M47_03395 [Candidatus Gracilibacteria bacterium]|nr:hypothetical protein [Candidatus Gracilibacteria bacterium]MCF7898484.1 hypothetical protein [Candidatus Paceibacterota bacterium]